MALAPRILIGSSHAQLLPQYQTVLLWPLLLQVPSNLVPPHLRINTHQPALIGRHQHYGHPADVVALVSDFNGQWVWLNRRLGASVLVANVEDVVP